jgi:hypothetical protein
MWGINGSEALNRYIRTEEDFLNDRANLSIHNKLSRVRPTNAIPKSFFAGIEALLRRFCMLELDTH